MFSNEINDLFNFIMGLDNEEEEEQPSQLDDSHMNQSLIESKVMKQVKQHLTSEK